MLLIKYSIFVLLRDLRCVLQLERGLSQERINSLRQGHTGNLEKSQESFLTELWRPHQSVSSQVLVENHGIEYWKCGRLFIWLICAGFVDLTNAIQQDECLPVIYYNVLALFISADWKQKVLILQDVNAVWISCLAGRQATKLLDSRSLYFIFF